MLLIPPIKFNKLSILFSCVVSLLFDWLLLFEFPNKSIGLWFDSLLLFVLLNKSIGLLFGWLLLFVLPNKSIGLLFGWLLFIEEGLFPKILFKSNKFNSLLFLFVLLLLFPLSCNISSIGLEVGIFKELNFINVLGSSSLIFSSSSFSFIISLFNSKFSSFVFGIGIDLTIFFFKSSFWL